MEKKPPTIKRSVSLSKTMNDDLIALTDKLGVNAHSYMINELAKSIQRDSLAFQMNIGVQDQISSLFTSLLSSIADSDRDITHLIPDDSEIKD